MDAALREDEVSEQRVVPFSLRQIRREVRLAAARDAIRQGLGREELLDVAIAPSDKVYWIRASGAKQLREILSSDAGTAGGSRPSGSGSTSPLSDLRKAA